MLQMYVFVLFGDLTLFVTSCGVERAASEMVRHPHATDNSLITIILIVLFLIY